MKKYNLFLLLILFFWAGCRRQDTVIFSPDHHMEFTLGLHDSLPEYSVSYKGNNLISHSPLSLVFGKSSAFGKNIGIHAMDHRNGRDDYRLIVGKTSHVLDAYREMTVTLKESYPPYRTVDLVVRVFNDGLAFRYRIPEQEAWHTMELKEENTTFNIQGNPTVRILFLPGFTTSHEGAYSILSYRDVKNDTLMDMPALFQFEGPVYMAITEAGLRDYAGMYLTRKNGILRGTLSPLPDRPGIKVRSDLPHKSPWRVLLISDRMGALIESNIITDLNEPCKIRDTSWIRPGKITFPWWNGTIVPDSVKGGNNFATNRYYIDFCARHGIEYHTVVEYGGHEWYVNDGTDYQPGPHADVTRPVPGLDMQQICDYAESKGVGIRVWVHWAALYPKLDTALALYEKWGIRGMMVDFMDRDDQEMVNIQEEILEKAAAHHLHIQFHGAYKPTGLWRTYPNELTREGVMNYEYDKWGKVTPDHDIEVPFTRMLAGPTDYHMGGFRAVPDSLFVSHYVRPLVLGSRCHMLAMYVVLENYLNMVADYPAAYEGQPGFEFIEDVPTTWDETKVLNAVPGKYITIARRKGNAWYAAAITNHEARMLKVKFDFLPAGRFQLSLYHDDAKTEFNPDMLIKETSVIRNRDSISLNLVSGGGMAMEIRPVD